MTRPLSFWHRRAKFARLGAAFHGAGTAAFHAAMKSIETTTGKGFATQDGPDGMTDKAIYIGSMTTDLKGPIATEIDARLRATLSPEQLAVIDDSEKHRGHAGHDGSGESHFTVEIVSDRFAGRSRIDCHRMVNDALSAELASQIHALVIRARAPGE